MVSSDTFAEFLRELLGRCAMILPLRALFFDRGGETHWQLSCEAKQSQCKRAHSMKSAIAKLAVFIGADSRFDLR